MSTLILLSLLACDADRNQEAMGWACEEVSRAEVADTSVAADPMDFAADPAILDTTGHFAGTLFYEDPDAGEVEASASLQLAAGEPVEVVDQEIESTGDGPVPELGIPEGECPDYYDVPVTGTFSAGNGGYVLYQDLDLPLVVTAAAAARFSHEVAWEDYEGPLEPSTFEPAEMDETWLRVHATFAEGLWTGEWSWMASRVEDTGDEGVAMAVNEPLGTFELEPTWEE